MTRLAFILLLSLQAHAVSRLPANIVGDVDGRGPITATGPAIGLNAAEIKQIRSATGYMICPGTDNDNAVGTTAFLIRDDVVVTVAHAFWDEKGRPRSPWGDCHFKSQDGRKLSVRIDPSTLRVGSSKPAAEPEKDYAVVQLRTSIPSVEPLMVVRPSPSLAPWMTIFPVASFRTKEYMAAGESLDEQLIQMCQIRRVLNHSDVPDTIYSDCDNTPGGSGGPSLLRLANGQLVAVSIMVAAGFATENRKPYREEEPISLAFSVQIKGPFLALIQSALVSEPKAAPRVAESIATEAKKARKKIKPEDMSGGFLVP